MGVKISALLPKPAEVDTGNGTLLVHPLSLEQITSLITSHRNEVMALFNGITEETLSAISVTAPLMVRDIIAVAARVDEPEEIDLIRMLPGPVQLEILLQIWRVTVPQPKKLAELLSMVQGQLQSIRKEVEVAAPARPPIPDYKPEETPTT